jgi:hypothetical protein
MEQAAQESRNLRCRIAQSVQGISLLDGVEYMSIVAVLREGKYLHRCVEASSSAISVTAAVSERIDS